MKRSFGQGCTRGAVGWGAAPLPFMVSFIFILSPELYLMPLLKAIGY